jgi:hypothetical protein
VRSRHPHLWEEQANGPCWHPLDSGTFEVMEGAEVDQQAATVDPPASRDDVSSQRHQGRSRSSWGYFARTRASWRCLEREPAKP